MVDVPARIGDAAAAATAQGATVSLRSLAGVASVAMTGHATLTVSATVQAREYNDAQVVGVGARMMHGPAGAAKIVEVFLGTLFSGGERHTRRIRLIADFDTTGDAPPLVAG